MFKPSTAGSKNFVKYSSFLGGLYLASKANEATVAQVKTEIGEDLVKKGFVGLTPESSSGKARKSLADKGVDVGGSLIGTLKGVSLRRVEDGSRKTVYLAVDIESTDNDGVVSPYSLSVDLGNTGSQQLAQKLSKVDDGTAIELSVFATYGPNKDNKFYANHGASVTINGEQVRISRADGIEAAENAAIAKLQAAGIDDREIISAARRKAAVEYCVNLIELRNPPQDQDEVKTEAQAA